jgi:hypothetical protein
MHRRRDFRERQVRHDDMLPDDGSPQVVAFGFAHEQFRERTRVQVCGFRPALRIGQIRSPRSSRTIRVTDRWASASLRATVSHSRRKGSRSGNGCHCAGGRGCERTSAISCCSDFRASLRLADPMDSIIAYTHTLTGRGRRFCAAVPSHVWFAGLECRNTPMPLAAYRVSTEQRSPFPAALGVRFLIVTPSSAHPC